MTIIVLPFANSGEDTNLGQWRDAIPFLLKEQLRQTPALRILLDSSVEFGPDDTVAYAYRQVQPKSGWSVSDIRRLGEAVEAQVVIAGSYEVHGGKPSISVQLVHVLTDQSSGVLTAAGSGWFETICQIRRLILERLQVVLKPEEEGRMSRPPTKSAAALAALARGLAGNLNGAPAPEIEKTLRNAIALDGGFVMAQDALGLLLSIEGHDEEALRLMTSAVRQDADSAAAHHLLGVLYYSQYRNAEAEAEFQEAQRLDPNEPLTLIRHGEMCYDEGKTTEAMSAFKRAEELEPYSALVHVDLARAYARTGKPDTAERELRMAEHFDATCDIQTLQQLGEVSALLHQAPAATKYYARFIEGAKAMGLNPLAISDAEASLAELKARLSPHFVRGAMPRLQSQSDLATALNKLLSPHEFAGVTNPFTATPAMIRWAKRHVAASHSDLDRAQSLFAAITHRIDAGESFTCRTAEQAFEDLSNPKATLSCQDYAFLYVALARAVELKAFFVLVNRNFESNLVAHACAGVFIGGRALLVDPQSGWFGVPHVDFAFEDDVSAISLFLAESGKPDLERIGVKLRPAWALPRFFLALTLAPSGASQEARQALEPALKLDSRSWWSFLARGVVEYSEHNGPAAMKDLQSCLAMDPEYEQVLYFMGKACQMCGRLEEARGHYRSFLDEENLPDLAEDARHQITVIDDKLDASEVKAREK